MFLTLRNRKRTINLLRFIILLWTINNWSLSDQEFLLSWTHMGVVGWFVSFRRIWNLLFWSVLLSQTNNWRSSCLDQCLQFNYDLEFIMSHGEYFPTSNSFQENSGNWNGMKYQMNKIGKLKIEMTPSIKNCDRRLAVAIINVSIGFLSSSWPDLTFLEIKWPKRKRNRPTIGCHGNQFQTHMALAQNLLV